MPLALPHSVFLSWDEADQDKALEYLRFERERCSGCGTRRSEWERDRDAYVGADPFACEGCRRIEREQQNVPEQDRGPWWRFGLMPRAAAESMNGHGEP